MSTKPTDQEIATEIEALKGLESTVRPYSMFGDDNRAAVRAQIDVLTGRMNLDQVHQKYGEPELFEEDEFDFDEYVLDSALSARDWMVGTLAADEEKPSDSWSGLVQ